MAYNTKNTNELLENKPKFSAFMQAPATQKAIMNTLQDETRKQKFTASIISAVTLNPALQECEPQTILSGALLGEALNLSPSPQLGHYFLVPFKDNKTSVKNATFQMGYKGYIQLAIRSGLYKNISVREVRECDDISLDNLTGEIIVKFHTNYNERLESEIIGYYSFIRLITGFEKSMFMSKQEMLDHADKYSPAFNKYDYEKYITGKIPVNELWKYSSYWYKSFDDMAFKTMIRQIISKWGVMSIELQKAYTSDDTYGIDDNNREYINAEGNEINETSEKAKKIVKENQSNQLNEVVNDSTGEINSKSEDDMIDIFNNALAE
ncbi:MAG: recombinase RecT [Candidatus Coprovivens sp.]